MIALARKAHPGIDFQVAEVTELPFPGAAFETVICNFALGHFPKPDAALAECVRVLAPGGALAFSWWDQPERQRVQGLFREVIAELALPRLQTCHRATIRYDIRILRPSPGCCAVPGSVMLRWRRTAPLTSCQMRRHCGRRGWVAWSSLPARWRPRTRPPRPERATLSPGEQRPTGAHKD